MLTTIDNIGIAVSNLAAAFKFYELLGFTKTWEDEKSCMVQQGPMILFLFQTSYKPSQKTERQIPDLFNNPPGVDYIAFQTKDVDAFYHAMSAKGIHFVLPPADQAWGARMAAIKDPDGNALYFIQRFSQ